MTRSAWICLFAELGPILAFFVAGQLTNFFTAVAVLMGLTAAAVALSWYQDRRFPVLPILSALFVLIGGALTLILHEPHAIIFADTLYYLLIVAALLYSVYREYPLLDKLLGTVFALHPAGWSIITWRWIFFLSLAALSNEFVRNVATPEFWIDYRFYKTIIVTAFILFQFTLAKKYRIIEESNRWGIRQQRTEIL